MFHPFRAEARAHVAKSRRPAFFRDGAMVSQSRAATIAWELVLDFLNRHT